MNAVPFFEQLEVLQEQRPFAAPEPETQFRDPLFKVPVELVLPASSDHRGHAADLSGSLARRFR
jgi:hypothetical protein